MGRLAVGAPERVNIRPRVLMGFHGSSYHGGGDGNGAQVAGLCDYTMFHAGQSDLVDRIREAKRHGLLSVVSVMHLFWHTWWSSDDDGFPIPTEQWNTVRPDAGERWAAFVESIRPVLPHVVAFVQLEEPFTLLHFKHELTQPGHFTRWAEKRALRALLLEVNQEIRTTGKLSLGIFAHIELNGSLAQMPGPCGFDAVGFNCYLESGVTEIEYAACLRELKATYPDKPLILFPDAYMGPQDDESAKRARIQRFFDLARDEPQVAAFMAYLWGSEGTTLGARDLPWVQELYRRRAA